jgi:hypothetical protein
VPRLVLAPVLVALLPLAALAREPLEEIPLPQLAASLQTSTPGTLSARGLDFNIGPEGAILVLPLPGREMVELSVVTDSIFTMTYAALTRRGERLHGSIFGPPWRYVTLSPGAATLRLDLFRTAQWSPESLPVLKFDGAGRVTISHVRAVAAPGSTEAASEARDRDVFWAPESIGQTTINYLTPRMWSVSANVYLDEILAGVFFAVAAVVLVASRLFRGRFAPAAALAAAALVATLASDASFLAGFLSVANTSLTLDADARIRAGYPFAPELGALSALARHTARSDERVGVMVRPTDWFLAQTLCFNLAPRRCVRMEPGQAEYAGISGVTHLRDDEIDVIVSFTGDATLPAGFVPVARLTPRALIARRR